MDDLIYHIILGLSSTPPLSFSLASVTDQPETRASPRSPILQFASEYAKAVGRQLIIPISTRLPILIPTRLDFTGCRIGPSGAIFLASILAKDTKLTEVRFPGNEIGDEGAVAIARMVKGKNRSLQIIILDNNGITTVGQRALLNAIFDNSSYDALEESNHVLEQYYDLPLNVFRWLVLGDVLRSLAWNSRSNSDKTAVTKKLELVLRRKYSVRLDAKLFLRIEADDMPYHHVYCWVAQRCDLQMIYEFKSFLVDIIKPR